MSATVTSALQEGRACKFDSVDRCESKPALEDHVCANQGGTPATSFVLAQHGCLAINATRLDVV